MYRSSESIVNDMIACLSLSLDLESPVSKANLIMERIRLARLLTFPPRPPLKIDSELHMI